uniref:Gypsy retrotransposon integrase-like protein 1 n=1 Tax=Leptobrachium leishanense TaxID=445787 RepID=A0A8C5PXI8_9ANUR
VLKSAILNRLGLSDECYRNKFRNKTFVLGTPPRAFAQQLKDLAYKWLKPATRPVSEIMDLLILEQYIKQLPKGYRRQLLQLSHSIPLAGHLGREKTLARLLYRFFWPGVYKEVEKFCKSCPECQLVAPI